MFLRGTYNHPFLVLTYRFFLDCEGQVEYKVTFNVSVSHKCQFWSPLSVIQAHLYCTQTHSFAYASYMVTLCGQVIAKKDVYA